jgi:hypothetical protein
MEIYKKVGVHGICEISKEKSPTESIEHSKLQSDTYLYKVFDFAYTEEPVVIKNINSIEKILIKKKKKSNF